MLDRLINAGEDPLNERRNAIRDLVNLIQKYHGDFNDVLLVEVLAALRSSVSTEGLMA